MAISPKWDVRLIHSGGFDKGGKTAIAVPSLDKLPSVLDTLITAVRNGEFDEALAQVAKQATPTKPKKAV